MIKFYRLWVSTASSNFGDGLLRVLLPLLALAWGASGFEVSLVVASSYLPWLFGSLLIGVFVDRLNRSTIIRAANVIRVLATFTLLAVTVADLASVALLVALALVYGVAEVAADLSSQSAVSQVVKNEQMESAYGRISVSQVVANTLAGPAVAGLLFGQTQAAVIGLICACYAIAALAVPAAPYSDQDSPEPWSSRQIWRELRIGVAAVTSNSWLRRAALSVGVMNFASGANAALLVTYAVSPGPLQLTTGEYGLLLSALGIGSMIGSAVAARVSRLLGESHAVAVGVGGLLTTIAAPGLSDNVWVIALSMTAGSAVGTLFGVKVISMRQRSVPNELLGRVNSAFQFVGIGSAPLGATVGGLMASMVGMRPVFLCLSAVAALTVVLLRPWHRKPAAVTA
ncbi:MFS transporter [Streptomyces sp. NPDC086081]|uniref:MFS transporter n=1 Tax=Streptomyces sp. NPDC086081 TaxID=3365749 RepID=UPI00382DA9EF